jgi:hypothetical protein
MGTMGKDLQSRRHIEGRPPKSDQSQPSPYNDKCPVTGASHSSLLDFSIHICPKCHFHINGDDDEYIPTAEKGTLNPSSTALESLMLGQDRLNSEPGSMPAQISEIRSEMFWLTKKLRETMSESESDFESAKNGERA